MGNDRSKGLRSAIIFCLIVFIVCFYLNIDSVNCDTISRRSRQINEQFAKEWKPEHETLYEETLDAVLECLYENKSRVNKIVMTVIRLKPLLNQICNYNSDYLCLEELIEPEILDILEKKAKEMNLNDNVKISDSNCKLCELICNQCKNEKLNESEKKQDSDKNMHEDLVTQDTEAVPVYLKYKQHQLESKSRNKDDTSNKYNAHKKNPCENCKTNPITDLINIVNGGNGCVDKLINPHHQDRQKKEIIVKITDEDETTKVNNETIDSSHEDEEGVVITSLEHQSRNSDEKTKHDDTNLKHKENTKSHPEITEHQKNEPKHKNVELKSKEHSEPEIQVILKETEPKHKEHSKSQLKEHEAKEHSNEEKHTDDKHKHEKPNKPIPITQDNKKLAQMHDVLHKLLCIKPESHDQTHNKHEDMSIYPPPGCLPKYLTLPLSYGEDDQLYPYNSEPLIKCNPCNNAFPLHNPIATDPTHYYDWKCPNYHKCSYFHDMDQYGAPYSLYSKTYSAKTDIEESYM